MSFWKTKTLAEMTRAEWESLCDGCGLCCLFTVEDPETGDMRRLGVACRLLDLGTCRCTDYANRTEEVPGCLVMTPESVRERYWLPETCAYRIVARGGELPEWHHLVCGDPDAVHDAGVSAEGRAVSERDVDLEDILDNL